MEVPVSPTLAPTGSKKNKSKAPAPPTSSKHAEALPVAKDPESEKIAMEHKENVLDTDVNLTVVLPGGGEQITSINGSKPVMDLLVYLCGKYHLNPSSHTMDLLGREKRLIRFKPNTLVGTLEVETVILKQKQLEEKKRPIAVVPEQTVRVVVNYKKTQKTIVRVSPNVPLQELVPVIGSKCEFDTKTTLLVKSFECQDPLDLTKSLNELGLREVYAMDTGIGSSQAYSQGVSVQQGQHQLTDSMNSLQREKENKGFLNFFRLSKKKREKAPSAPATPPINQQRQLGTAAPSAHCPTYESNTLPSTIPKKRRAPPPPLSTSQSVPKDLSQQTLTRPLSYVLQTCEEQDTTSLTRQRAKSLRDETLSSSSSLKRTKRKAPLPPCKVTDQKSPDPEESVQGAVVSCPSPNVSESPSSQVSSPSVGIGSEHSLDEIAEKEETRAIDIDDVQLQQDTVSPNVSVDISTIAQTNIHTERTDVPSPLNATDEQTDVKSEGNVRSFSPAEDVPIFRARDENLMIAKEVKDQAKPDIVQNTPISGDASHQTIQEKSKEMSPSDTLGTSVDKGKAVGAVERSTDTNTHLVPEHSVNLQPSPVKDKGHPKPPRKLNDVSRIQTEDVNNTLSIQHTETLNESIIASPDRSLHNKETLTQGTEKSTLNTLSTSGHDVEVNKSTLAIISSEDQNGKLADTKPTQHISQGLTGKEQVPTDVNTTATESLTGSRIDCNVPSLPSDTVRSPSSSSKAPLVYKCESEPKPKPSNEITREYTPKIGMTTYKIVPSKSLGKGTETLEQTSSSSQYIAQEPAKQLHSPAGLHQPQDQSNTQNEPVVSQQTANIEATVTQLPISPTTQCHPPNPSNPESVVDHPSVPSTVMVNKSDRVTPGNKMNPGSMFLHLQKRKSGQYVTSAIARTSSLSCQSSFEEETQDLIKEDNGMPLREVSSPDGDNVDIIIPPPPEFASQDTAQKDCHKPADVSHTGKVRPSEKQSRESMCLKSKSSQALRTTMVAKKYNSTSPSPFALAVSSAVRKTQTPLVKAQCAKTVPLPPSSVTATPKGINVPPSTPKEDTYHSNTVKQVVSSEIKPKNDWYNKGSQPRTWPVKPRVPPPTAKKPILITQISDPGAIHQAVLDAIRSGEGAAKLKKNQDASENVSINGKSIPNRSLSSSE
ncbi:cordon-bleu protein-like 1b isoform X1 [Callorhinchus milii]|uniref:cordon-bleu protein-like 1b isoform X1 n=2 Tax=Callorhinchus milii TaxID=7868 RepID=UPI001C3FA6AA|nr:cordon-bleu protein-like 1b isoform X1 [Callorhinchus milii]